MTIPVTWIKRAVGILLLPACLVTTLAFFDTFTATAIDHGFWRSQEFWFFALGVVLWLIWFWGLPRPMTLYVLGHELTHAFFILLCGGRIEEFRIGSDGGHVVTNRNNVLISLSPYFVPFYSIVVIAGFVVAGQFTDLTRVHDGAVYGIADFKLSWLLFGLIGLTWGFHLTFTVWMIGKDQPDLRENGVFFSLVLIFLANLLAITGGLVVASPDATVAAFASRWWTEAEAIWAWTGHAAASLL